MRINILLLILNQFLNFSISAQSKFLELTELFPEYSWEQIPEDMRSIKKALPIGINETNELMWGKHASVEIKNGSVSSKAPHYIDINGTFKKGTQGKFRETVDMGDSIFNSKLCPIAKIRINSDIVMLILLYQVFDENNGWLYFYEAYTYRMRDEQLLSSLCLWNFKLKSVCVSFIKPNRYLDLYRTLYFSEQSPEGELVETGSVCKTSFYLRDDGYFQEMDSYDAESMGLVFWAKISDKDGWSNIREQPNGNSKVLFKAIDKKRVLLEKIDVPNWFRIISYKDPNGAFYHEGFIHASRIEKYD